jgi:DNA-binding transcriptional MerR regulator
VQTLAVIETGQRAGLALDEIKLLLDARGSKRQRSAAAQPGRMSALRRAGSDLLSG